jgi:hypothetical protein
VLRFDERAAPWERLRQELKASQDAPVLISGFHDTIRPLMIASAIRAQPHVLGDSILRFWQLYALDSRSPPLDRWSTYNTRLSHDEYLAALRREGKPWPDVHPRLIERSLQAAVPVAEGYPEEWSGSRDVFAPRLRRISGVADVFYRHDYAVVTSSEMTESLDHDAAGPFRLLTASGRLIVHDRADAPRLLTVEYDGAINDVQVGIKDQYYGGQAPGPGRPVRIQVVVNPAGAERLTLAVARPVKLRAMAWAPISP